MQELNERYLLETFLEERDREHPIVYTHLHEFCRITTNAFEGNAVLFIKLVMLAKKRARN